MNSLKTLLACIMLGSVSADLPSIATAAEGGAGLYVPGSWS